ncbi:diguanylate cyclase [Diaphorobacter nitroreducens]|uniref:GGDEF domain-containing protein n=1 Tax=Diaphorobacter nitroreducens TaxID=164759 RepID=UPI0028A85161|nr:diguanylate cyclase [Diaphorobacter nitroreducens]
MASAKSPSEIARETLKLLATRRLPPTPDHYQALYDEVAGTTSAPAFPSAQLRQISRVIPGQTPAQKRLLGLLETAITQQDWGVLQNVLVGYANLGLSPVAAPEPASTRIDHLPLTLAQNLARLVDNTLPALGEDDARVHELAAQLSTFLREPDPPVSTAELMLGNFSYRLSFAAEDQAAIRLSLLSLLRLVFENIAALSMDDEWLHGQAEALLAASTPPLTLRRLDDVQRRLKDVIFKQTEAKERTVHAQMQMRELLATFIERLAQMDESSSAYNAKMEDCAERISQATQLQDIMPLLEEVMAATRAMALSSRVTRGELQELRERTEAKHAEIDHLRQELDRASAQARHDPLTGSLNRKGFAEAMEREIARARRQDAPLCVALLDVDNFKSINDRLGHTAGDAALVHLAQVTREVMRPQDQLARYGGEEFVIILPDTELAEGVKAMERLQRELTTRYFLKDQERVLITFSAGVAQVEGEEGSADAIRRADQGMYLAKRTGKNRVVAA